MAPIGSSFTGSSDQVSGGLKTITEQHGQIHKGRHFFTTSIREGVALNAVVEGVFTAPDTDTRIHFTYEIEGSVGVKVEIFEGATGVVGGSAATLFNSDRNSTNTPELTITEDPTSISDYGTLVFTAAKGSAKEIGIVSRVVELILKKNSSYWK